MLHASDAAIYSYQIPKCHRTINTLNENENLHTEFSSGIQLHQ